MKKFVIAVVILLGILFIISRFTEVQQIALILKEGNFWYLGLAVLIEAVWVINLGASFQSLFGLLGIRQGILDFSRLAIAANFVNQVAPSAGVSGIAVFISQSPRNGRSSAVIAVGTVLFLLFEYLGLLSFIFIGLLVLGFYNSLRFTEIIAFILFLALAAALTTLLILAARSQEKLASVLTWLAIKTNRLLRPILHREVFEVNKASVLACEAAEGISALKHVRLGWLKPLLLTFSSKGLLIAILGLMFLAFNTDFTITKLIAGFSIGYLFVIISPTPSGMGFVEGAMAITLHSLDIPLESAAIITMAFRGVTFWLPFVLGMITFRTLPKM